MKKFFLSSFLFFTSLLLALQFAFKPVNASAIITNNNMLPPSNLTYQLITPSDVKLTWSSVYGASGYNLYGIIGGELQFLGTTTSVNYTFNNLPEGSYSYVVSTLSSEGESGPCAPISVNITYPNMVAPATITSKIQNGNDIVLNWTSSQYAKTYNIYQISTDGQETLIANTSTATYSIINASAGSYTYRVSAVNPLYGESPLSDTTHIDLVSPTMTAPSNLTYSILNGNDISLKWNAVSYSTNYKIYQIINGQKNLVSTTTGTSITFANMPSDDYIYEVYSFSDRFGESQTGSQTSFLLTLPTMEVPSNLTYSIASGNDITLKWSSVSYATGYKVYQIIDGQRVLKSTITGTTITYTNMAGGDYVYEVHSYSTRFGESIDGSNISFTLVLPTMQSPVNLTYLISNGNDVTLKWAVTPYATGYKVYQIIDGQKILKSTVTGTTITYTNMAGGDYIYEVHSYSSRFGESVDGSNISFTLVLPTLEPPTNVVQVIKNATDFTLSWDATQYATSYKVYQIINGERVLKSTVSGTTVTYTNMSSGVYDFEIVSDSTRFGESLTGSSITVTLNGQTLQAPTNLTYTITNGNDITLRWTTAPYATSYKIYQVIDGQLILKKTTTSTSTIFTNMPAGDYYYIVNSVSTLLGESPTGAEATFTLILPTMTAPSNLVYKIQNGNDLVLTWSAVSYANTYKVYELINGDLVLKATVSSTSATFTNLLEGDHTYIVTSVSTRFGESQDGSEVNFLLVYPTMTSPSSITNSILNGNDINLKWTSIPYATGYKIYQIIDGQKILKQTVTGTSVTFANMPEGQYIFEVHSYSTRFGESQEESQINISLVFPIMQSPSNLTSTILNGNDINLRWTASTYATAYKIYQIVDGQRILKQTVTGTSITFTNMPEGDYNYEVYSYSNRFDESPLGSSINISLVWPTVQPPSLTGSIVNINNITFTWKAVTWANEYRVYEVTYGTKQLLYKGSTLTYKVFNLSEGTHSYQITAYSTRFGESQLSDALIETIIYPDMVAPNAALTIIDESTVKINWNFITYANGYNVYEIIDGNPVLLVENLNSLSYTINNLSYANHQYFVTSYSNSFGESNQSNIVLAKLIIDIDPPVTIAYAPINWTNQSPVTVTLIATDKDTGVVATYYSINDGAFIEGTSFIIDQEGINKICFYSVDKVGNIESTNIIYVRIDKTAPTITMNLGNEYKLGTILNLNYSSMDSLSGIVDEKLVVYGPDGTIVNNGLNVQLDKPGTYKVVITVTDAAGNISTLEKQFIVYIPANLQITSKVVKDNNGVITARIDLPLGYNTSDLDLNTATLNGVNALTSNNGYYNQAKIGQFKFQRSDFNWTAPEIIVEFRCYINGYLVIGQTTVKVQK